MKPYMHDTVKNKDKDVWQLKGIDKINQERVRSEENKRKMKLNSHRTLAFQEKSRSKGKKWETPKLQQLSQVKNYQF